MDYGKHSGKTIANMTPLDVANEIKKCIKLLEVFITQLDEQSANKATTAAEYDKAIADASIRLRSKDVPVSVIGSMAKGECSDYRLSMEQAKERKADTITRLETIKACLNGWQSIHKHFDAV